MVKCPFCANDVSDEAISCPHCKEQICEISKERRVRFKENKSYLYFTIVLCTLLTMLFGLLQIREIFFSKPFKEGSGFAEDLCTKLCNERFSEHREMMNKCIEECKNQLPIGR